MRKVLLSPFSERFGSGPGPFRLPGPGLFLAALLLAGAAPFLARTAAAAEPRPVTEPLFAFLFALAEGDSLGTWSGQDLAEYVAAQERPSRFPLDQFVRISRRLADPGKVDPRSGARLERIWEMELTEALDRPLPYSILGYHPGSLRVSRLLVLSEWALGDLELRLRGAKASRRKTVHDVRVLRLDSGYVVLDADAWVDRLLGPALDDSWTLGFVIARQGRNRLALAVNVGREGRRLYGEMDLVNDEVLAHGRPLADALSRKCRPLVTPALGQTSRIWQETE